MPIIKPSLRICGSLKSTLLFVITIAVWHRWIWVGLDFERAAVESWWLMMESRRRVRANLNGSWPTVPNIGLFLNRTATKISKVLLFQWPFLLGHKCVCWGLTQSLGSLTGSKASPCDGRQIKRCTSEKNTRRASVLYLSIHVAYLIDVESFGCFISEEYEFFSTSSQSCKIHHRPYLSIAQVNITAAYQNEWSPDA